MNDEKFTRSSKAVRFCPACRVAIMTLYTEEKKDDGTWETIKIVRNCGHKLESDPQ